MRRDHEVIQARVRRAKSGSQFGSDGGADTGGLVVESLAGKDVHAPATGLMEDFLEIPSHPWLGPPGMPASPYR